MFSLAADESPETRLLREASALPAIIAALGQPPGGAGAAPAAGTAVAAAADAACAAAFALRSEANALVMIRRGCLPLLAALVGPENALPVRAAALLALGAAASHATAAEGLAAEPGLVPAVVAVIGAPCGSSAASSYAC